MSNGKGMIIHLIAGLIKKVLNEFFLKWNVLIKNESILS